MAALREPNLQEELGTQISRRAESFRRAFTAYCEAEEEPDMLALGRQFQVHPVTIVKACTEQMWPQKRAAYQAAKASGQLANRQNIAMQIDAEAVRQAKPFIKQALTTLSGLLAKVTDLPDEPTAEELAGKDSASQTQIRSRYLNRKLDLTERATKAFMDTLERAANVGLLVNYERRHLKEQDDEKGHGLIDFSKLASLKITVEAVERETAPKSVHPLIETGDASASPSA